MDFVCIQSVTVAIHVSGEIDLVLTWCFGLHGRVVAQGIVEPCRTAIKRIEILPALVGGTYSRDFPVVALMVVGRFETRVEKIVGLGSTPAYNIGQFVSTVHQRVFGHVCS